MALAMHKSSLRGCTAAARAPVARRSSVLPPRQRACRPVRAIEIDWTDPDTQIAVAGCVLGLVAGLGAPIWYINRAEKDEERLEELRALNRATFNQTGEYMSEVRPWPLESECTRPGQQG